MDWFIVYYKSMRLCMKILLLCYYCCLPDDDEYEELQAGADVSATEVVLVYETTDHATTMSPVIGGFEKSI